MTSDNYYHIPEADALVEVSAMFRGWCNYYRYAQSPQPCFSKVAQQTWWAFAHYLTRKTKTSSIRKLIVREKKAGRLVTEKKNGRTRLTFRVQAGKKVLVLDIFPPRTEQIITLATTQQWQADLKPFKPLIWQSGRSFATRLEARDRAQGVCERCHTNPVQSIHHTVPMKGRSILARIMSDRSQQYTAQALCQECHVEVHGGSFKRRKSNGNAGYIERCSPSVGSAEQKPAVEKEQGAALPDHANQLGPYLTGWAYLLRVISAGEFENEFQNDSYRPYKIAQHINLLFSISKRS